MYINNNYLDEISRIIIVIIARKSIFKSRNLQKMLIFNIIFINRNHINIILLFKISHKIYRIYIKYIIYILLHYKITTLIYFIIHNTIIQCNI